MAQTPPFFQKTQPRGMRTELAAFSVGPALAAALTTMTILNNGEAVFIIYIATCPTFLANPKPPVQKPDGAMRHRIQRTELWQGFEVYVPPYIAVP